MMSTLTPRRWWSRNAVVIVFELKYVPTKNQRNEYVQGRQDLCCEVPSRSREFESLLVVSKERFVLLERSIFCIIFCRWDALEFGHGNVLRVELEKVEEQTHRKRSLSVLRGNRKVQTRGADEDRASDQEYVDPAPLYCTKRKEAVANRRINVSKATKLFMRVSSYCTTNIPHFSGHSRVRVPIWSVNRPVDIS